MADRRNTKDLVFFSAAGANGQSTLVLDVADYRDVVLSFATSGSATLTAKIQGGLAVIGSSNGAGQGEYIPPTFASAASISNAWDYIQGINLNDGSAINGSTGVVYAGTDAVKLVEVNTNLIDYLTVVISGYSAGALTVKGALCTNQ